VYHESVKACLLSLIFCVFPALSQAVETSQTSSYAQIFRQAQYRIDILTPGFFSIRLSKLLKTLKSKGILIRILTDVTFMMDPENSILELHQALPLRILDEVRRIPHNLILVDHSRLYLGGAYFSDEPNNGFEPTVIQDRIRLKKAAELFQTYWTQSSLKKTLKLVRETEFHLENETTRTSGLIKKSQGASSTHQVQNRGYIASGRSKVYHRASSTAGQRIKPENRIYFQTEEDARKTNRRRAKNF
jgi:hypothetical protein